MQQLEALTREASALARGESRVIPIHSLSDSEGEVARVLQICNACRYCEGFCAVFPAMTRRIEFGKADIHYLANLCHNCGACLHACQYAPPHEFAVNVPRAMAKVRLMTYTDYAWPPAFGALYRRNGLTLCLALVLGLSLFLMLGVAANGSLWGAVPGGFYGIFPHNLLAGIFGPVFLFAMLALGIGVRRFWREEAPGPASKAAVGESVHNVLKLKYLDGGHGEGCNNADDAFTHARRRFHHLTFYGFLSCFASTSTATLYHYAFGWHAPYDFTSLPKLFGIAGGVMLAFGTAGLFALNLRRHALQQDPDQKPMDRGFIALLFLTATSGLALMLARGGSALPVTLCVHLGCVIALFATLPYGKFAHGIFRSAALLKWSIERRQPSKLQLGDD
ncbi:tricarballylate utilization 4Fe-4S protein TcuB [Burkholderia sp. Ac-20379]|uniref:tricarballylate utilization 4Fe-4S protein TcuB n=1 Tax=Burkholderia sp. Ac-20379 TaxID=2703900 RepID=UPI00197DE45D|nr:tricarballylate utilization 4Fe-4S protein TcuB [Burkholderia sp. Ac-20379]MBN3723382.1 tricarballylate utilization 4Fe-4S protein TcuB [Burkholderia sp. Ac-20379]